MEDQNLKNSVQKLQQMEMAKHGLNLTESQKLKSIATQEMVEQKSAQMAEEEIISGLKPDEQSLKAAEAKLKDMVESEYEKKIPVAEPKIARQKTEQAPPPPQPVKESIAKPTDARPAERQEFTPPVKSPIGGAQSTRDLQKNIPPRVDSRGEKRPPAPKAQDRRPSAAATAPKPAAKAAKNVAKKWILGAAGLSSVGGGIIGYFLS